LQTSSISLILTVNINGNEYELEEFNKNVMVLTAASNQASAWKKPSYSNSSKDCRTIGNWTWLWTGTLTGFGWRQNSVQEDGTSDLIKHKYLNNLNSESAKTYTLENNNELFDTQATGLQTNFDKFT